MTNPTTSKLAQVLQAGQFAMTAETSPHSGSSPQKRGDSHLFSCPSRTEISSSPRLTQWSRRRPTGFRSITLDPFRVSSLTVLHSSTSVRYRENQNR